MVVLSFPCLLSLVDPGFGQGAQDFFSEILHLNENITQGDSGQKTVEGDIDAKQNKGNCFRKKLKIRTPIYHWVTQ